MRLLIVGTLHGILYIIYIVIAFAMTRAVRIPWPAAKTASWGPSARARGSEDSDRTVTDHHP